MKAEAGIVELLTEAIHDSQISHEADGGVPDVCNRWDEHEADARAILATPAGSRLTLAPAPEELDDVCARIGGAGYASDAVAEFETWTERRWGVVSAFTTGLRIADALDGER